MKKRQVFWAIAAVGLLAIICPARAADGELPPLTIDPGYPRLPGKFIWADLVTDDVVKARDFYSQLFGWKFWGYGAYSIAVNNDTALGGMFHKSRPANDPKARPRWFGYISVPNVAKAQKAVATAGGRVLAPAQNFPKRGEQAVFADPEGAIFGVMKSGSGDPPDYLAEPGDWMWIQLLSRDARKATEFYRSVARYEVVENPAANRLNDYILTSKGYARATVRTLATKREDVNPTWLPYVRVKNVSETLAKAKQLGGSVLIDPSPEMLQGGVAVIADPTGAAIGVMEWRPELMKGAR